MRIESYKDLKVYQLAYQLAMEIFEQTKSFPKEEKYSLIDQMRRSSRSVCTSIAEAWRKRRYPKYFTNKLTDADAEGSETQVWIDFSLSCKYINVEIYKYWTQGYEEIGKMLNGMLKQPEKFCQ
ncbi:MAG: four helix bundle protein [bacterium]